MGIFDEDLPKPKNTNRPQVSEDISRLSEEELTERIELLRAEINRTEDELKKRSKIRTAADALFK